MVARTSSSGLALDRGAHERGRGLGDRASVPGDLDVVQDAVAHVEIDDDLVAAERVEALDADGRRGLELTAVARASGSGRG